MKLDKLVKVAVAALEDVKAHNITVLNVIGATTLFDRMIIASADSTRQTRALANNVQDKVRSGGGAVYGIEGVRLGSGYWWISAMCWYTSCKLVSVPTIILKSCGLAQFQKRSTCLRPSQASSSPLPDRVSRRLNWPLPPSELNQSHLNKFRS